MLGECVVRASSFSAKSLSTRGRSPVVAMATATNQTGEQVSCKSNFFYSTLSPLGREVLLDRFGSALGDTTLS
jgi:hypothetical protein